MICVLAAIEVNEGTLGDFLGVLRRIVPSVRAAQGCVEYTPMLDLGTALAGQSPKRPNVVTIVEKWESVEALEAHLMTPHMHEFRRLTEPMRVTLSLQILQPA